MNHTTTTQQPTTANAEITDTATGRRARSVERAPRRRLLKCALVALTTLTAVAGGSATPASAEVDTLTSQCISVYGQVRGCMQSVTMNWGSGLSWRAYGSVNDLYYDNGRVQMEVKLNRKYSSNTSWMVVSSGWDQLQGYWGQSLSGYDPTYGASIRLCFVAGNGSKWCNDARYVADNS